MRVRKLHLMLAAAALPSLGALAQTALPYNESFDTKAGFEQFTVIDANADGMTWTYDDMEREVASEHDGFMKSADDWLITPAFALKAGVSYTLAFDARIAQDGTTETFDVMMGCGATAEAMVRPVLRSNSVTQTNPATAFKTTFTVDADGEYYIGFHHNSEGDMFGNSLCLDNISLSAEQKTESALPSPVSGVTLTYNYDTNLATLKWKAPTTTVDGQPLDGQTVTYTVRRVGDSKAVVDDYPGTTFREQLTLDMLPESKVFFGQGLACYSVVAHTPKGDSEKAVSDMVIIGTPDSLPYAESFADGKPGTFWAEEHSGAGRWNPLNHIVNTYVHDADRGTYSFTGGDGGDSAVGMTGRIALGGAANPVLSFWYYAAGALDDKVTVECSADGGEFETLASLPLTGEGVEQQWHKVLLPLDAFKGSNAVQVAFRETNAVNTFKIFIDDIRLYDQKQNDLTVNVDSLPANLRADEPRVAKVRVTNLGLGDVAAGDYAVAFVAGGKLVGRADGVAVKSGYSQDVLVQLVADRALEPDSVEAYARVDYAADEMADNDMSAVCRLRVLSSGYPRPGALQASANGGGVRLVWNEPEAPRASGDVVSDGFEDAPDFTISNWGDWVLADRNEHLVYSPEVSFPNASMPQAFTVLNPGAAGLDNSWAPHAGNKELAAFSTSEATDHWLISPELSMDEQTVVFFARPYSQQYIENFEVMYSLSSQNTSDFAVAKKYATALNDNSWKQYVVELPEGARYFAIHYTSDDGFAMLFDDFTFTSALSGAQNINLLGYNVYCDGIKVNGEPVSGTSFDDAPAAGDHTYTVTAVYDRGESGLSAGAAVTVATSVGALHMGGSAVGGRVYDAAGRVVSGGYRGIVVKDGRKMVRK